MSQQAAKILSVPTAADYVLPARPRGNGEIVVVPPTAEGQTALRRGGDVARAIGARVTVLAEGQRLFLEEVRERLVAKIGILVLLGVLPVLVRRGTLPRSVGVLLVLGLGAAAYWIVKFRPF